MHVINLGTVHVELVTKKMTLEPVYLRVLLFLGHIAKLRKATINFVMSVRLPVCPHVKTRLPIEEFLRYITLENF